MPSKIQLNENLWFLFICLQKSDYKTIDFNAVGKATNLKSPAARMRYTRLRRQIEGGTLTATHGTHVLGITEQGSLEVRKRARASQKGVGKDEPPTAISRTTSPGRTIKSEPEQFSDRYDSDSSEGDDSEDDKPLAKRRNDRLKPEDESCECSPAAVAQWHLSSEFSPGLYIGHDNRLMEPETRSNIRQAGPGIHEDYVNGLQNSSLRVQQYVPANHSFAVIAKPLGGNENFR